MKAQTNTTLVQLAKQGNPKAIETLLNRQLESKGITAKFDLKGNCLQILLESDKLPPQHIIFEYLRKSFTKLSSTAIKTIKIYGKETGKAFFDWDYSFNVESAYSELLQLTQNENNNNLQIYFDEIKNEFSNHLLKIILTNMGLPIITVDVSSSQSEDNKTNELFDNASKVADIIPFNENPIVNSLEGIAFAAGVVIVSSVVEGIWDSFKSASDFYKEGINFMESKLYSEALGSFAKAIAKDKQYADAFYQRGNIYFIAGHFRKAYEEFNQVISIIPTHIEAYKKRALVRYALEDYDGAISDNTFAINKNPNDYTIYFNRAIAYFTTGIYTNSLDDLTRAIQLNTQNYLIYLMRADIYLSIKNNPNQAIQDFNSAIRIQTSYEAYLGLAIAYSWNKQYNNAIRLYTEVISSHTKDLNNIAYKGRCLSNIALNKKWDARLDAYRGRWRVKQLNFNIAEIIILLGIPAILILVVILFKNYYQNNHKPRTSLSPVKLETLLKITIPNKSLISPSTYIQS